jgi:hypothetical protein
MGLLNGRFLPVVLIVAVLAATAALFTLWWMSRSFHNRTEVLAAAVRGTSAVGVVRFDLPPLVGDFLAHSGVPDPARMRWVRIEQRGEMRLSPDDPWLPFTAVQHMAVARPAFVWRAEMRMAGGLWTSVVDGYSGGEGQLEARLMGAIPVARAGGEMWNGVSCCVIWRSCHGTLPPWQPTLCCPCARRMRGAWK